MEKKTRFFVGQAKLLLDWHANESQEGMHVHVFSQDDTRNAIAKVACVSRSSWVLVQWEKSNPDNTNSKQRKAIFSFLNSGTNSYDLCNRWFSRNHKFEYYNVTNSMILKWNIKVGPERRDKYAIIFRSISPLGVITLVYCEVYNKILGLSEQYMIDLRRSTVKIPYTLQNVNYYRSLANYPLLNSLSEVKTIN